MKKDIKDYLHLYLGCDCMIGDLNWKREEYTYGLMPDVDLDYGKPIKSKLDAHVLNAFPHKTTLILRPLSDMTPQEKAEYKKIAAPSVAGKNILPDIPSGKMLQCFLNANSPFCVAWLLSKGFDLFGLIEAGLAIDKTKIGV